MHISQLKQSKFLTRGDVAKPVLVTIQEIFQDNVAKEGAPEELKWCIAFPELEKPMVLNSTNGQIIAQITKSEDTDSWAGHKIVLYDDPTVSFGGKLTGGIRVRAPRNQPAPAAHGILGKPQHPPTAPSPAPVPAPSEVEDNPPF